MTKHIDKPLVVDLDGTLINSNMLHECFWSAFKNHWYVPFLSIFLLIKGRQALKRKLFYLSAIEVKDLPYNLDVLNYIKRWKNKGGYTVLASASDEKIVKKIAAHLDIFDEYHGSNSSLNLRGIRKARYLKKLYGDMNFIYMGDSAPDVDVWKFSFKAITIDASNKLKRQADKVCALAEHLETKKNSILEYLLVLRPLQWLKNILIFVPMLTAHQFTLDSFLELTKAFVAFCVISSCVYIINDLFDLQSDRSHPTKKLRPFAAGKIKIEFGLIIFPCLFLISVFIAASVNIKLLAIIITYLLISYIYTAFLKKRIVIDLCILALLYTLRLLAGSVVLDINLSIWLIAFSGFFFMSLAAVKRLAELMNYSNQGEKSVLGRGYNLSDVPIISSIASSAGFVSILVVALYINSPLVINLYKNPQALWGICGILIYWISRLLIIAHRGNMDYDPVVFAAKDKVSYLCLLMIALFFIVGIL
ncbi:UbiA family prenyltransferase [Gammaproteobacteria bacterium]|jgi:4-hydroxybenzoate polyprenyltransferase|nr:UbiA family prenyltransferase [Gammaproteobacteria bacterium]